jgi:RNA polymerase sigma-70 factor (ECF subfamily)
MSDEGMSNSLDDRFDGRFIARLRHRDEQAFSQLVLAYEERVYKLAWRMLGNQAEAEDMTQEVFVQVFRNIHSFRGEAKLGTWLYRIAINLTKNRNMYLARRHHHAHTDISDGEPREAFGQAQGLTSGETSRPDMQAMGNQAEKAVMSCLSSLEQEYREVLVLRDVECLSYEEVGAITGLAAGTVKSRLHRARALLKKAVLEILGEDI